MYGSHTQAGTFYSELSGLDTLSGFKWIKQHAVKALLYFTITHRTGNVYCIALFKTTYD